MDKIRNECTERMKSATRRYAKRQVQWIRNKLLPIVAKSKDVDIYLLDATGTENRMGLCHERSLLIGESRS